MQTFGYWQESILSVRQMDGRTHTAHFYISMWGLLQLAPIITVYHILGMLESTLSGWDPWHHSPALYSPRLWGKSLGPTLLVPSATEGLVLSPWIWSAILKSTFVLSLYSLCWDWEKGDVFCVRTLCECTTQTWCCLHNAYICIYLSWCSHNTLLTGLLSFYMYKRLRDNKKGPSYDKRVDIGQLVHPVFPSGEQNGHSFSCRQTNVKSFHWVMYKKY